MYLLFAIATAFFYVTTARPGSLTTRDFCMIAAVAVFSILGLTDGIRRK
jgi:hypothetical protein